MNASPDDRPGFEQDKLSQAVIECVIRVHSELGPGFNERVYHNALIVEFTRREIAFASELVIVVEYLGVSVGEHRLDLLVDGRLLLELKAVEELTKAHYAQVRSYLKAAKLMVGLLINFGKDKADFRRIELKP